MDSFSEDTSKAFASVLIKCLLFSNSYQELITFWKDNINMIEGVKKFSPDVYEEIRMAFAKRRAEVEKNNG